MSVSSFQDIHASLLSSVLFVKNGNNNLQDNPEINNHDRWFFKTDIKCEQSTLNDCACLVLLNESVGKENL